MSSKQTKASVAAEVKAKTVGYITAGLGLVASLAWNEAIKELIAVAFPQDQNSLWAKFLYAFIITTIVVIAGLYTAQLVQEHKES